MKFYILRGLPGSGKSTQAKMIAERYGEERCAIVSADHFFERLGKYDSARLTRAHAECQLSALKAITEGKSFIIVDNTNTTKDEFWFYTQLASMVNYEVEIISLFDAGFSDETLAKRNVHNVPAGKIRQMRMRWEN